MQKDSIYIQQILESISKIRQYTQGLSKEHFFEDQMRQSAVMMQLTLIGELAKKISDAVKSEVVLPWKEITGFRDRAIHNYFQIDLNVVWGTIVSDLDVLE